jgi:hypothetical protein
MRTVHERSNTMSDIASEKIEIEEEMIFTNEFSDASLETAANARNSGALTQFANCTFMGCPA